MAINTNAQTYADRWSTGLQAATQKITDGVNGVTVAPGVKAAASEAKYLAGVQAAVTSHKWANRVKAVTLQEWKDSMTQKGIPRIATGAQAAVPKMAAFAQKLLPYEQTLQAQILAMPGNTLPEKTARAVAWINGMSKFVY